MKRNLLSLLVMSAVGAAAAAAGSADNSTEGAAAAPAARAVPDSTESTAAAKKTRAPKDPAKILNILNGRIPLPLVFLIRFKVPAETKTADVAKAYGTSVGKVFDIRKNANFGYIKADYLPSAEEVKAANAWLTEAKSTKGQSLKELGGDPDGIKTLLDALTTATPEQVAARGWETRAVGAKAEPAVNAGGSPKANSKKKADGAAKAAPAAAASMF